MTGPLLPEQIEELMAGYVLGNLTSEEAEEFKQLLTEHPELETELRHLQEVLEVMPYALPEQAPPPHLRQSILNTVTSTPKPVSRRPGWGIANLALWERLRNSPKLVRVLSSTAALLLLVLGLDNYRIRLQVTTMQTKVARQKDVIAMLQKPDTHVVPLKGMAQASAATGSMLMASSESQAVLILKNLPVLPRGQSYQLWSVAQEEKVPWGQFRTSKQGTVFVKLPRPSNFEVSALLITVEVSPSPTTPAGPMVMAGNL
jgi:anti-sigma-K factor RskA